MKKKDFAAINPFLTEGYAGPEYFCDRVVETSDLVNELSNGNNVTLFSPRRMGKTGLIHHSFETLKAAGFHCIYLDIMNTWSLQDFTEKLASAVISSTDGRIESFIQKAIKLFGHLRPIFSIDAVTGLPSMSLNVLPGESEHTLESVFNYIKGLNRKCCIAIDEFQQIREYPEKGTEALLRSLIQFLPDTVFIFSGSRRHLMNDMFINPKRPFYESTSPLHLSEIDSGQYYSFASDWFRKSGRLLGEQQFSAIYDSVFGHTWYVQKILNTLYYKAEADVMDEDVSAVFQHILKRQEDCFVSILRSLTAGERKLLTAIAHEGTVTQPQSAVFIKKYALPAASTIKYSLTKLVEKEIIYDNNGHYSVYNRFLALWLKGSRPL